MVKPVFFFLAYLGSIFASGLWAQTTLEYNRPSAIYPKANLQHGKALATACLACHGGTDVKLGQPAFHPPKLHNQRLSTIFYALEDYRSGARKSDLMAATAQGLSEQDMRDVAGYLSARSLRPLPPARPLPMMANSWAHQKNEQVCSMCHGEAGLGVMDGYPVLAGQHQDYLEHALLAYRSGQRSNPIMQTFARSLKPQEIKQITQYFAAQSALGQSK